MKYMITWNERPQGSPIEYENAQKRILEVLTVEGAGDPLTSTHSNALSS